MRGENFSLRSSVFVLILLAVFAVLPITVVKAFSVSQEEINGVNVRDLVDRFCNPVTSIFCDNFIGKTFFINQQPTAPWAHWYKYPYNRDGAASYKNVNKLSEQYLQLQVDDKATANNYSFSDISTSEINNYQGNFLFGENVRVDVRMRYSPNMFSNAQNTGTAKGSAGFLLWNYFTAPVDPEMKDLNHVRDAFGYVWQDQNSFPNAGFWTAAVGQSTPGTYLPLFDMNLSEWHTYSLERRHDSMKFYIDGQLIETQLLNQEGGIPLPATSKMSVDIWADNASYVLDLSTMHVNLDFNDLTETQYVDIDMVRVKNI